MGVPRLGIQSELQPLVYTTATEPRDPSHVCDLHHSSRQRRILNPLSEAGDGSPILMDTSQFLLSLGHNRNSPSLHLSATQLPLFPPLLASHLGWLRSSEAREEVSPPRSSCRWLGL